MEGSLMSRNKYYAKRTECRQGHMHASAYEARWCNDLTMLERAGEITHLEQQPQFWFKINGDQLKHTNGRKVGFKGDFSYRDRAGKQVVVEAKGVRTEGYVLRAAIFRALFPYIELREV
jgi:hypothetical protein